MRRGDGGRLRVALATSGLLHALLVAGFWQVSRMEAETPRMRVYSVNIVSPPPREQGEWSPAPAGEPAEVAEPEPEVQPEPEPTPPPEPSPAPKATTRPAPKETPRETPKAAPKETPRAPTPAPKSGNEGTSARSTGAEPSPTSAGGENLDVRTEGARFTDPAYLENIVRQVNRYFRRPPGSVDAEAEVRFWIDRDGSVSEIEILSASNFRIRTAAMEAVEQAGTRKAFGPLPRSYPADRLPVSFYFRPSR